MSLATSKNQLSTLFGLFGQKIRWRRWFDLSFFLCGGLQNQRFGGRAVGQYRCRTCRRLWRSAGVVFGFRLSPCCQVPKAVVASLGKHYIKVDTGNLTPATFRYLVDLRCPVHLPVNACDHLIHIFSEEHGEERGVLDFFTTLQCCNLVSLDLQGCSRIHAGTWQRLNGAKWLNLKKADFSWCLAERNGWRFSCFPRCVFVSVGNCSNSGAWWDMWSCRMSWRWHGWV